MQNLRSTVFIPLRELSLENSQLLIAHADLQLSVTDTDNIALNKNLNMVAAPLMLAGLYDDGHKVVCAMQKLLIEAPRWALYQKFYKKYAWINNQRLNIENPQTNCEGSSAQLGLAIALLLNANSIPLEPPRSRFEKLLSKCSTLPFFNAKADRPNAIMHAIATGCINGEKHADKDIAIGEVGSVPEKLDLILKKRQENALPAVFLYCFTPTHYELAGERLKVADLPQIAKLAELQIAVKPIDWLSEAQKILNAHRSQYLPQDKILGVATSMVSSLLLGSILYLGWWHNPIPLKILPGKTFAEPYLICTSKQTPEVMVYDLPHSSDLVELPLHNQKNARYNTHIAWTIKPEKTFLSNSYYSAAFNLGRLSGYKPSNTSTQAVEAGKVFERSWQLGDQGNIEEESKLVVVFQRTPINADTLHQAFRERFHAASPLNVQEAADFITARFPGSYVFTYNAIENDDHPCLKDSSS